MPLVGRKGELGKTAKLGLRNSIQGFMAPRRPQSRMPAQNLLTNSDIAELLAIAAESAKQPLQKALRRASRKAFLWPEKAAQMNQQDRSLEELPGVGPSLKRIIRRWIQDPPDVPQAA